MNNARWGEDGDVPVFSNISPDLFQLAANLTPGVAIHTTIT